METEIRLKIVLVQPPRNVRFAVQRGRKDLIEPSAITADEIAFDVAVRVKDNRPDGRPNFLGDVTQGPVTARFIYVNSGTMAGETASCWTRRAKVPLTGITWEQISAGEVLEARIRGTSRDGGPVCASVPLLDGGWRVTRQGP